MDQKAARERWKDWKAELRECVQLGFSRYPDVPLFTLPDKYDLYQRLLDYWDEQMQDDVYLVAADGWLLAATPRRLVDEKGKKGKESPDLIIGKKKYKMDLLPPAVVIDAFFREEQDAIDELQMKEDEATRALEEFIEEHTGDEGLLEDAKNDKEKITKASLKDRLKSLGKSSEFDDEREDLKNCEKLLDAERCSGEGEEGGRGGSLE